MCKADSRLGVECWRLMRSLVGGQNVSQCLELALMDKPYVPTAEEVARGRFRVPVGNKRARTLWTKWY